MRQHGQQHRLTYFIGSIAISLSLYTLFIHKQNFTIAAASIYFVLICFTDCRYGKIPNLLNLSLAIYGLAINAYLNGLDGLLFSLSGLALGLVLLIIPYLAGGFGAGDVKALGAIGALIGPYALLHVFAYMGLFGGALALLHNLFHKGIWKKLHDGMHSSLAFFLSGPNFKSALNSASDKNSFTRFPYATAIAFGYLGYVHWGGII